jgi:hypothetical protein
MARISSADLTSAETLEARLRTTSIKYSAPAYLAYQQGTSRLDLHVTCILCECTLPDTVHAAKTGKARQATANVAPMKKYAGSDVPNWTSGCHQQGRR